MKSLKKPTNLDGPRLTRKQRNLAQPKTNSGKAAVAFAIRAPASPGTEELDAQPAPNPPGFSVPLPPWDNEKPVLSDNVPSEPTIPIPPTALRGVNLPEMVSRIRALKAKFPNQLNHVTTDRSVEESLGHDTAEPLRKAPHPDSDFSHVDPGIFTPAELQTLNDAIDNVENAEIIARRDGEASECFGSALGPLVRARDLLAQNAKGMQRLKLVFEWTLCHVTTIFGEINAALANSDEVQGKADYNAARERYITLLKDLDDHDPHSQGPPTPGERGYGITIKWAHVLPLIHKGIIKGASVEAKWNPHLSSSGIPIPHE